MKIPEGLFEYLISGLMALIVAGWVIQIHTGDILYRKIISIDIKILLLFIPLIYVVGMCYDLTAKIITSFVKKIPKIKYYVEDRWLKHLREGLNDEGIQIPTESELFFINEHVANRFIARSSRDRIARNLLLTTLLVALIAVFNFLFGSGVLWLILLTIPLSIFSLALWIRFQSLSNLYSVLALLASHNKHLNMDVQKY